MIFHYKHSKMYKTTAFKNCKFFSYFRICFKLYYTLHITHVWCFVINYNNYFKI